MLSPSSSADSHTAKGWNTHAASRFVMGVSALVTRATAPPHGIRFDWARDERICAAEPKKVETASSKGRSGTRPPSSSSPRRVIEHALEIDVGHRAHEVDLRTQRPEGRQEHVAVCHWPVVAHGDCAQQLTAGDGEG